MATTLGPGASTTCQFERVLDEAPDTTHTNIVTVSAADDETMANLAVAPEFQDGSLVPVTATSQASVLTVGPDLELTKSDAGFVATAGQQTPFPYTITVTNIGEGEVNPADAVTVVDDLPDAFEWVAPAPAGCTINGQQLTCSLAAASLRPAGTSATVVATARVAPGAVAGNFDNRAYVTTLDDPVTAPPSCTDTEAVAADNNVDCETTPVASSITTDLASECVNNAPYITYDITPFGFTPSGGATLTFYDLDGNLVDSTHVADLTGRVLYPGAQVDAAGIATDWPGWKFENGAMVRLDGCGLAHRVGGLEGWPDRWRFGSARRRGRRPRCRDDLVEVEDRRAMAFGDGFQPRGPCPQLGAQVTQPIHGVAERGHGTWRPTRSSARCAACA